MASRSCSRAERDTTHPIQSNPIQPSTQPANVYLSTRYLIHNREENNSDDSEVPQDGRSLLSLQTLSAMSSSDATVARKASS